MLNPKLEQHKRDTQMREKTDISNKQCITQTVSPSRGTYSSPSPNYKK